MNKAIPALTLLCGFLMGVIAGPWLWPRDLLGQPVPIPSPPPQAATEPEISPAPAASPIAPPSAVQQEEPELVLKGVLVGEDAARSRALIAHGKTEPRLYKPDDKLPDGSVLKLVDNKHVEVEKDGEIIQLTLDRGRSSAEADVEAAPAETPGGPVEPEPAANDPSAPAPVTASAEPAATEE